MEASWLICALLASSSSDLLRVRVRVRVRVRLRLRLRVRVRFGFGLGFGFGLVGARGPRAAEAVRALVHVLALPRELPLLRLLGRRERPLGSLLVCLC